MSRMEEEDETCRGRVDQTGLREGFGRGPSVIIIISLMLNGMTWS